MVLLWSYQSIAMSAKAAVQKLSISVPKDSARFIEQYRKTHGLKTRSEVITRALGSLRERELEAEYRESARELREEMKAWDVTVADGLPDEAW